MDSVWPIVDYQMDRRVDMRWANGWIDKLTTICFLFEGHKKVHPWVTPLNSLVMVHCIYQGASRPPNKSA